MVTIVHLVTFKVFGRSTLACSALRENALRPSSTVVSLFAGANARKGLSIGDRGHCFLCKGVFDKQCRWKKTLIYLFKFSKELFTVLKTPTHYPLRRAQRK